MMKSCLISILVSLVSLTASWGQAKGTQITETDSTVTLRNSKVRVEFPKGEAFDISKLTLSGKELILGKGYNTVPWTLTYKGPQGENPVLFPSHGEYAGWSKGTKNGNTDIAFKWNMRLTYNDLVPVVMTVSVPDDSELVYWDIQAGTPEGWLISNTQFPRVTVTRPDDAKLITSAGWGAEYELKNPKYMLQVILR